MDTLLLEHGLHADLGHRLFGQHIASHSILNAVNGFMTCTDWKHPLVLSLHGTAGTGKNFASQLIAKIIYKEGMNSKFVHLFISTHHFPHSSQVAIYQAQLKQWIKGNASSCEHSVFIFDEMDKMHPGLINSIKPFLDYHSNLEGVCYRRSIFIFHSLYVCLNNVPSNHQLTYNQQRTYQPAWTQVLPFW
ncbi:torsin-1B-like [Pholidichthys leucotaenia]